jgi:hypothetical protein
MFLLRIKMIIKIKKKIPNTLFSIIIFSTILGLILTAVHATPSGPTIDILSNETKNATTSTKVNTTINGTISPGGYIFTTKLDSIQQNSRWKAYVGNVTGTLTLDDAYDNTIYQWSLTSIAGEVYATRASGNINWSGINCTWIAAWGDSMDFNLSNASIVSNRTPEHDENIALNHTSVDDNITATFASNTNHSAITIGTVVIGKDECYTIQTWQRDAAQSFSDSDEANFTEILLYDGAFNKSGGNIVYATFIENDKTGFDSTETYDFQMILPENGLDTWTSSTAYYFYVELT